MSLRGMPEDWEICRNDLEDVVTRRYWVRAPLMGDVVALISAIID